MVRRKRLRIRRAGAKIYCRFKNLGGGRVVKFCVGGSKAKANQQARAKRMNRNRSKGMSRGRFAYGARGMKASRPVGKVRKVAGTKQYKRVGSARGIGKRRMGVKKRNLVRAFARDRKAQTQRRRRARVSRVRARIARSRARRARM
jgi:hypothetical protein